jgi:hypothetical protein
MRLLAATLAALAALALSAAPADAKYRTCQSSDLRYPFQPGGPKTFGVFRLKIERGACTTAHRVAKRWKARFEVKFKLPREVAGFTFTTLPPNAAQTYRLRGRKGRTTLRFNYVVPNG